jgi:hypothetical protein
MDLDLFTSGIQYKMRQRLIRRFETVGAISKNTAVSSKDAKLDLQEQYWLPYFGGSFIASIKKPTDDQLYYLKNYVSNRK